jgi:hypothetical protein
MKKVVLVGIVVAMVSGCAAFNQNYKHKDTGQKSNCFSWGFGWLGVPIAIATYFDCKREHEKAGYVPIEEETKEVKDAVSK